MILLKLVWLPVRLVFGTAKVGTKVGYRTGRLVGYRRIFVLGVGVVVGLLVAPVPGRELRAAIRRRLEARGVTGIVLTKLDGTAKGGVVIAIARELNLPIRYVGIGEKVDDLLPFDPEKYIQSIFEQ